MPETQTLEHSVSNGSTDELGTLSLVRLIRLRRDDDNNEPSRIYAHVLGERVGGNATGTGQAALFLKDDHLLLSPEAWDAGEHLIQSLQTEGIPLGSPERLEEFLNETIDRSERAASTRLGRKSRQAYRVIGQAVREAVIAFAGEENQSPDNFGEFIDTNMAQVNRYAAAPSPAAPSYEGEAANAFDDAPYIEPLPKDGTKGYLLEREALRYGMASTRYPSGAFVVTDLSSEQQLGFKWGRSPLASGVALSICSYKEATRRLLKRVDVPVPSGRVFSIADRHKAVEFADRTGYPVVCKPVAGLRGIGVVANIQSREELESALELYQQSELGADDFVIEEHVPGEDYRIVVIGDEVVASVVRAPASVTGDGLHTVADLIEYKNRARNENPHLSSRPIKFGQALKYQLKLAGLAYSSVPAAGQVVTLANSANLSQGGDSFEIADEMHPSIKELSVKAVQAVPGLGFCGLDMLIEDHTKPVWEQQVTVIELNAHAAIGSAQYPMWGTPAPVAKQFFETTATRSGIVLPDRQSDTLSLKFVIRGRVTKVGYRKWFQKRAAAFGLTGYVKNADKGRVEAYVYGKADAASAIGYLAMEGSEGSVPTSVTMLPVPVELVDGFEIRTTMAAGPVD